MKKNRIKKEKPAFFKEMKWTNFIGLLLAGFINSIGVILLLNPVGLLDSGISGLSLLLDRVTPSYLVFSMFLIALNFPFYIIAHKKIGPAFTIYSLFAILIYSLFAFIFKDLISFNYAVNGSPISGWDILLSALFGGLLSGIGSGLTIRFGGAMDGVEVMSVMFAKKIGISTGGFVMAFNVILYTISAIIFKSWEIPLYSIIAYFVGTKTIDFIVEGLDKANSAIVVTEKKEVLAKALSDALGRGITILDGKGYYSDSKKYVIYLVVNRFEIMKLKKIVKEIDPDAFVSINEVSDTLGNEFRFKLKGKKEEK